MTYNHRLSGILSTTQKPQMCSYFKLIFKVCCSWLSVFNEKILYSLKYKKKFKLFSIILHIVLLAPLWGIRIGCQILYTTALPLTVNLTARTGLACVSPSSLISIKMISLFRFRKSDDTISKHTWILPVCGSAPKPRNCQCPHSLQFYGFSPWVFSSNHCHSPDAQPH